MAKIFEYDLFKTNLLKVKETQTDEIKKEATILTTALFIKSDLSNIEIDNITNAHLDFVEKELKTTLEFALGNKQIDDIKDNVIVNSNFKENLEKFSKSINSLRTENPIDLF
ncbi:MAG: hypothetical protein B6I28_03345 [Fusobacteriia bacterium 4572_132]|nr:MAG: hypothetical protein B6I28_03345 [Fusobacteriia bacterium 4572_132]